VRSPNAVVGGKENVRISVDKFRTEDGTAWWLALIYSMMMAAVMVFLTISV